ncbi:hypothetical protein NQZ68_020500 [Dissostichus eleginoides]|nr:hypothetical protein NQZ68_020500 [Dissostichus eleginoides]
MADVNSSSFSCTAAKCLPADQILSDKSGQLSLRLIRTDMPAPRRARGIGENPLYGEL